jgi:3-oxoacyl-[acyl-carrier protein] reductase
MRLKGRVAVVTGAARGLGREYALRFAREGASVAALDLAADGARETAALAEEEGAGALSLAADVTDEQQMTEAIQRVAERFGRIDVLVNNAALYGDMDIRDQSLEYFAKLLNVNVLSVIASARAVFPHMKQQRSGSIINISSSAAYPLPFPTAPDLQTVPISGYAVSKAAVINLTKSMAKALGVFNIRVNAIAPGITMTESTKKLVPGVIMDSLTAGSALHRALEPGDIVGTAVFLASEDSALMTGQVLVVDAGLVMLG